MALALPLSLSSFFDTLKVRSAPFLLVEQQEYSGLGTGEGIAHDLAPRLWEAAVQSAPMPLEEAQAILARIDALDGAVNAFYAYNPAKAYPAADPDGSKLGAATPTIYAIADNRKEFQVTGLPPGYVLTAGDMVAVDYGTPPRRALVRLVTGAAANNLGLTPMVEARPHLRPGITAGLPIGLRKPAMKAKIVAGSLSSSHDLMVTGTVSFTMRQTLAAGGVTDIYYPVPPLPVPVPSPSLDFSLDTNSQYLAVL